MPSRQSEEGALGPALDLTASTHLSRGGQLVVEKKAAPGRGGGEDPTATATITSSFSVPFAARAAVGGAGSGRGPKGGSDGGEISRSLGRVDGQAYTGTGACG